MKVNKLKLSLGVLTVLTTPIAVNIAASSDVLAAQGWINAGNAWYFHNQNGTPVKNKWVGNYWLGADGKMATNAWVDNSRYYVDGNGVWVKDAKKPETKKQGWKQEGTVWYYLDEKGIPVKNIWIGNYWLGADGKMATNAWVDNKYYYVGKDGAWIKDAKKSSWLKEGKVWYYLDSEGTPVKNKWIGNYWLGADGKMAINSWVDNNNYYVDENGLWDKTKKKLDPVPTGEHTGWVRSGSTWYYFSPEGKLVKNKWVGNYWLGANGNMETNAWVDSGRYYVGSNGVWVPAKSNKNVSALNMPQYYQWDYRWGNKKYGFGTMAQLCTYSVSYGI